MTLPSLPTLTPTGTRYAEYVLLALCVLAGVYEAGSCSGARTATDRQDSSHAQALHDSVDALERQLPALEAKARLVDSLVALTVKPHEAAKVQTDTMGAHEASARAALEARLADSLATLEQVRAAAQALVVTDSLARAAVLLERDAANSRILALNNQHQADSTLLAKDAATLQLSTQAYAALEQVNKDLKAQQPNGIHRAVRGVLTVAAGGACGGLGLLASPLVAFGGAIACGAIVGAVLH